MAKRLDFLLDFSLDFSNTHILQGTSAKNINHHNYLPDFLEKVAKLVDFHSTTNTLLDFFDKDQTSLNIYLTQLDSLSKVAKRLDFSLDFCRVKNRVKNRVVWPEPYMLSNVPYEPLMLADFIAVYPMFNQYSLHTNVAHWTI